ncbi:unnamed protein product [Rhizophagus irregularis]|nr:unnamed protein product [Rhizophagus irregularis]
MYSSTLPTHIPKGRQKDKDLRENLLKRKPWRLIKKKTKKNEVKTQHTNPHSQSTLPTHIPKGRRKDKGSKRRPNKEKILTERR